MVCLSSGWSAIRIVCHQGGLSSRWSVIRAVCHQAFYFIRLFRCLHRVRCFSPVERLGSELVIRASTYPPRTPPLALLATAIIVTSQQLLCVICVFPCHRPLGLPKSKDGLGIFNVRNDLSACCVHEGETGTDEFAQMLTREN